MAAFTDEQQAIMRFMFNALNGQLADVRSGLHRACRDLIALAAVICRKGIEIDSDEWEEAAREVEAAHQVELAFAPRMQRGEELIARLLRGEEVPEDEINQWLRDVEEGRP
jgi:hypothetical protein